MKRYKPLYIERYDFSEWKRKVEERKKYLLENNITGTISIFPFSEAVIRVDKYTNLIVNRLNIFYKGNKNKELSLLDTINYLNKWFKSFNIIFEINDYDNIKDKNKSGINDMFTSINESNNIVYIIINANFFIKNLNYSELLKQFSILIKHELIHKGQFLKMKDEELRKMVLKNKLKTKSYLEIKSEIMAYANTIIEELRFGGFTDDEILEIVRSNKMNLSNILDEYIKLFKIEDNKPEVLNRLYKYIYEYLKG